MLGIGKREKNTVKGHTLFSLGGELVGEYKENKPWNVTEMIKMETSSKGG